MEVRVDTDRIKQLRRARAMSQEELAAAAGLSLRTIQRIESDGIASLESKRALSGVFGVTPEALDDTREETSRFLSALKGGTMLGMAGALIGGASAYFSISLASRAGEISVAEAGAAYGVVAAVVGLTCALIGLVSQKLRTRAERPVNRMERAPPA